MDSLIYKKTWLKAFQMPYSQAWRFLLREGWRDVQSVLLMLACPAFFLVMIVAIASTH